MAIEPINNTPSNGKPTPAKPTAPRSPALVTASFPQAMEMGSKVYEANHRHVAGDEAIALALGAKSLNGTSSGKIATLKKFGILEAAGGGSRISEQAYTLFELGTDTAEGAQAAREMALRPQAFQIIRNQYGERLPSDASIRVFLFGKGYQKEMAEQLIRLYRETVGWLDTKLPKDTVAKPHIATPFREAGVGRQSPIAAHEQATPVSISEPAVRADQTRLQFKVSADADAVIIFTGPVTQQAIDKLITLLDASSDVFPDAKAARPTRTILDEADTDDGEEDLTLFADDDYQDDDE